MSNLPPPPPPPPPGRPSGGRPQPPPPERGGRRGFGAGWPKWTLPVLIAVLVAMFVLPQLFQGDDGDKLTYTEFIDAVEQDRVESVSINNSSGKITGEFKES